MRNLTFALYFGNRGFFPETLIAGARDEMKKAVEAQGISTLLLDPSATKFGAVETAAEGEVYAEFLKDNEGKYDGVVLCLPNFGDENGAIKALRDCGVPILIQAYPDEIGKMDFNSRRDSFCGKLSIMDVFYQNKLPFTAFEPHTVHPLSETFTKQIKDFAAVCRVVKALKRLTVGAIGARTTAFKTVRFDEITLQKYGITVETLDLSQLFHKVSKLDPQSQKVKDKIERLVNYTNFSCCPPAKTEAIAKVSVAIDDIIEEYKLDCLSLRCWNEFEEMMGISPCVILSELNDRGFAAACELDVLNAIPMHALAMASELPATCLDWNNNYGEDPDKCILFHCGPVPQTYMTAKGEITDHKMFAKSYGEGCGWGTNEGRIKAFPFTFASSKTENGKLIFYMGEGEFTEDEIEAEFFGCGGVARIDDLQRKMLAIGKNGYRHHVSVTAGLHEKALKEAFSTYLGFDIIGLE